MKAPCCKTFSAAAAGLGLVMFIMPDAQAQKTAVPNGPSTRQALRGTRPATGGTAGSTARPVNPVSNQRNPNAGRPSAGGAGDPDPEQTARGAWPSQSPSRKGRVKFVEPPPPPNELFPPTIGLSFAYVVDVSGSMGARSGNGTRISRLGSALTNSINGLNVKQFFYINAFDSDAHPMPSNALVKATQDNKQQSLDWYQSLRKGGGTDPLDSITAALDLKPEVIFFLTDGEFGTGQVQSVIDAKNSDRKITIHTVCLGDDASGKFLKKIADENGGTYRFIKD